MYPEITAKYGEEKKKGKNVVHWNNQNSVVDLNPEIIIELTYSQFLTCPFKTHFSKNILQHNWTTENMLFSGKKKASRWIVIENELNLLNLTGMESLRLKMLNKQKWLDIYLLQHAWVILGFK